MDEKVIDLVDEVGEGSEEVIDLVEEVKGETTEETSKRFSMAKNKPPIIMPLIGVALFVYGFVTFYFTAMIVGSIVISIGLARCFFKTKRNRLIFGSLFTIMTLLLWFYYLGG